MNERLFYTSSNNYNLYDTAVFALSFIVMGTALSFIYVIALQSYGAPMLASVPVFGVLLTLIAAQLVLITKSRNVVVTATTIILSLLVIIYLKAAIYNALADTQSAANSRSNEPILPFYLYYLTHPSSAYYQNMVWVLLDAMCLGLLPLAALHTCTQPFSEAENDWLRKQTYTQKIESLDDMGNYGEAALKGDFSFILDRAPTSNKKEYAEIRVFKNPGNPERYLSVVNVYPGVRGSKGTETLLKPFRLDDVLMRQLDARLGNLEG